ncbi:MAG: shikimate kinase [Chloroflexota bacterium]
MGAGKTTVGTLLATRLACPLDDSDATIIAEQGRSSRELQAEIGTDAMHALEVAHLLGALARPRPRIVTPAAYCIEVPACRDALAGPGVRVVWLRARPQTLAARFGAQGHRPIYGADPGIFLAAQAERRHPLFGALAELTVDVDALAPAAIVARVLAGLGAGGRDV